MSGFRWNSWPATILIVVIILLVPLVLWAIFRARSRFLAGEEKKVSHILARDGVQKGNADYLTRERLETMIRWYVRNTTYNKWEYTILKLIQIVLAALLPFLSQYNKSNSGFIIGIIGIVIVLLEGFQQLGQYHQSWINYHATRDALTQEKFLYLARAGPYSTTQCPKDTDLVPRLAENIEALIAQDRSRWATLRQQPQPEAHG